MNHTAREVGPGKYDPKKKVERGINNPTIPRADNKNKTQPFKKRQMIMDPYDEEEQEEPIKPGPGSYL